MMHRVLGLAIMLVGAAIFLLGIAAGVAWIVFCFGTVIIGLILLFFLPAILFAPFGICSIGGPLFIIGAMMLFGKDKARDQSEVNFDDDSVNARSERLLALRKASYQLTR